MATIDTNNPATLMRKLLEAVATKDLDTMRAMWHDDVVDDFVALGKFEGKDAVAAFFAELFTAVPDMQFTINRIVGGDDRIAVGEWSITGTFSGGPFQGLEPTGRHVELRGVDVMEFDGGLLCRTTIYYDGLRFARQVGMLPAEGSSADRAMTSSFNTLIRARKGLRHTIERLKERSAQDS
jgi:steroid delta-isomerase-like uncharacterized protein